MCVAYGWWYDPLFFLLTSTLTFWNQLLDTFVFRTLKIYENENWIVGGRTKISIEEYMEWYNINIISFEDSSESSRLMCGGGTFEIIEKYNIFLYSS